MRTLEQILGEYETISKYSLKVQKMKALLQQNLSEEDFYIEAAKIDKTITYYIAKERLEKVDPQRFMIIVRQIDMEKLQKVADFLMMPDVYKARNKIKALEQLDLPEKEFWQRAGKINSGEAFLLLKEKYEKTNLLKFRELCEVINWPLDDFFPLMREVCSRSRKIRSTDISLKTYNGVI